MESALVSEQVPSLEDSSCRGSLPQMGRGITKSLARSLGDCPLPTSHQRSLRDDDSADSLHTNCRRSNANSTTE